MSGKAIRKHELRKAAREHVDHEMARFLDLHVEINRGSHQGIVLGAILTAYASHARNLLSSFCAPLARCTAPQTGSRHPKGGRD